MFWLLSLTPISYYEFYPKLQIFAMPKSNVIIIELLAFALIWLIMSFLYHQDITQNYAWLVPVCPKLFNKNNLIGLKNYWCQVIIFQIGSRWYNSCTRCHFLYSFPCMGQRRHGFILTLTQFSGHPMPLPSCLSFFFFFFVKALSFHVRLKK